MTTLEQFGEEWQRLITATDPRRQALHGHWVTSLAFHDCQKLSGICPLFG